MRIFSAGGNSSGASYSLSNSYKTSPNTYLYYSFILTDTLLLLFKILYVSFKNNSIFCFFIFLACIWLVIVASFVIISSDFLTVTPEYYFINEFKSSIVFIVFIFYSKLYLNFVSLARVDVLLARVVAMLIAVSI